jgi:hypothetical protein
VLRRPIITTLPSRSTPSSNHPPTTVQPVNSFTLPQKSISGPTSTSSHSRGTKPSCAIMQGTTFEVEWSVMDLKNSSVFAPTSAQPSRRPSAIHPLHSQSQSQSQFHSHYHSQIVVLPLVRLCITFLLNLSLSSSPLSALKPDSMSSGKGARSGAVVELLSAS